MKQQKKLSNIHRMLLVCFVLTISCNNEEKTVAENNTVNDGAISIPKTITYNIVNEYPHDPTAFTEGLEYKDGILYESTGRYGHSDVRKVELVTGKVLLSRKMEARYFGEGLTVMNGKIYQLTYKEGKGFVYDAGSLKPQGSFSFNATEGWGMTNNGTHLIFNDGGNVFHFVDPVTFKEIKQLRVTDEHGPVNELNEPEVINGYIYANQWRTDYILKIDTVTGKVTGRADLGSLRQRIGIQPPAGDEQGPDVLNGIAYDAVNNRIFITGKNWPKLLEIKLDN